MDQLTNLLACVGKPIYLLSVVVQTNVVPGDAWDIKGWKTNGGFYIDHWRAVTNPAPSTNYSAALTFGFAEIGSPVRQSMEPMMLGQYKTNIVPLFTNFVTLTNYPSK